MGSGGILIAKDWCKVIAVDLDEKRLEMARELGADYTFNPAKCNVVEEINRITNRIGVDTAIVTGGGNAPLNTALDAVRTRGKVALIAESNKATIDPSNQFLRKRTELIGCWYFNRADWEEIANFNCFK